MQPSNSLSIGDYTYSPAALLGKGATGSVYRGFNAKTHEPVAIKIVLANTLKDEATKMLFENEKKALKMIKIKGNPNVIKLHDVIEDANATYLITEQCSGGTLQEYLKRKGKLTEDETIEMARKILNGAYSLIQQCILHRDLKPANIMLRPNSNSQSQEPVIIDLGYSEIILARKVLKAFNVGSPAYMSPEAYGKTMYSEKSETWAIAVTIFQMLNGKTPDQGIPIKEYFQLIKNQQFVKGIIGKMSASEQIKAIIMKGMAYLPEDRLSISQMKYQIDLMLMNRKKQLNNAVINKNGRFEDPILNREGKGRSFYNFEKSDSHSKHQNQINEVSREVSAQKKMIFPSKQQKHPQFVSFDPQLNQANIQAVRSNQKIVFPAPQISQKILPSERQGSSSHHNIPPMQINFRMELVNRDQRVKTQKKIEGHPPRMIMKVVTTNKQ